MDAVTAGGQPQVGERCQVVLSLIEKPARVVCIIDKIRVVVLNSIDGETRITQIEAFHLNDLPQPKIAVTHTQSHLRV